MNRRNDDVRRDDGFTLAATMAIMGLTLAFVGVAVGMALAGLTHSESSRSVERAQAAADAGADIAGYRMNKTLLAPATSSILGLAGSALQTVGCAGLSLDFGSTTSISTDQSLPVGTASVTAANTFSLAPISVGNNFCLTTQSATLDDGETYRYAISTKILLGPAIRATLTSSGISVAELDKLIVRQVAAIGEAGGQRRRVIVSYWLNTPGALLTSGTANLTKLFLKRRYVRCPSQSTAGFSADPFANCPANLGY